MAKRGGLQDQYAVSRPICAVRNKTHSVIHAVDAFATATTGKQIEVAAGTVEVHDIFISAVEAAKDAGYYCKVL